MAKKTNVIEEDCLGILRSLNLRPLGNKKVLLTGASGLLGQYIFCVILLANRYKKLNCQLTCVSLRGPSRFEARYLPAPRIKFKKIDLSRPFEIGERFDYIFHAAGYGQPLKFLKDAPGTVSINVDASKEFLANYMRPRGTFVFFSSGEIYGNVPISMKKIPESYGGNVSAIAPRAVYAESKRLGEAMVAACTRDGRVRGKIVRISHVYGPGVEYSDTKVMSDFIRSGLLKKKIRLLDEGMAIKTYGYVGDVAEMIFYVALYGKNLIYNVGGTDTMSVRELAEKIAKQCAATVLIPRFKANLPHVGSDARFMKFDLSKIRREMKNFSFTPFDRGLSKTIVWFKGLEERV